MGPREYLRRRRERESALGRLELDPDRDGSVEAPGEERREGGEAGRGERAAAAASGPDPVGPAPDPTSSHGPDPVELPGADQAELASMLGRALARGTPEISTAGHSVDGGEGVAAEILALLAEVATPASEGIEVSPTDAERLLEQVRARLAELESESDTGRGG
jgi:hypothetical protein